MTSVGCALEDEARNHILAAKAVKLKVHDAFKEKGYDCVLVQHEISVWIDLAGHDPAMHLQSLDPVLRRDRLRISLSWNVGTSPNHRKSSSPPTTSE